LPHLQPLEFGRPAGFLLQTERILLTQAYARGEPERLELTLLARERGRFSGYACRIRLR